MNLKMNASNIQPLSTSDRTPRVGVHSGKSTQFARAFLPKGFSLIELLTVMGMVAVLLSVAGPALSGITRGRGVDAGINLSSGVVNMARSTALLSRQGARVLIDMNPSSKGYLRQIAVVQGVRQTDGTIAWKSVSPPQTLPEGIYFSPDRSNGYQTMQFDFKNPSPQLGGGTGSPFAFFEYDGSGRFVAPPTSGLARLVVVPGILENSMTPGADLVVPNSMEASMSGFIFRKAGHVTYFRSSDQIENL